MSSEKRSNQEETSRKKKKTYAVHPNKTSSSSKSIAAGMIGLLITCARRTEKYCVREAYDLLNDAFDQLSSSTLLSDAADKQETTNEIEKSIEKELTSLSSQRFNSITTFMDCLVFIQCVDDSISPSSLALHILNQTLSTGSLPARYIERILPLDATCFASLKDIEKLCDRFLPTYFPIPADTTTTTNPITFSIDIKIRHHDLLKRDQVIDAVASKLAFAKVDLTKPDKTILIQIWKNVCGMSVVEDFNGKYKKYNLKQIVSTATPTNADDDN